MDEEQLKETKVKKRRVTKACDQCRRRRIRCLASKEEGGACLVCVENDAAAGCTFSAPTRKRGPAAGAAKSLAERVLGLERFIGHMLLLDDHVLLARAESFFHPPADSTPSDPSAQHRAFNESTLPAMFDSLPRSGTSSPVVEPPATNYRASSGSSLSPFDELPPHRLPGNDPATLPAPLALRPSFKEPFGDHNYQHQTHGYVAHLDGLQTLASVAVDNDRKLLPLEPLYPLSLDWRDSLAPPQALGSNSLALRPAPLALPSESIRNELFDLYFEQIVHLSYPMVNRDRLLAWSASQTHDKYASTLPSPGLPLVIFALTLPYASVASSRAHPAIEFAHAGRAHLFDEVSSHPTVETVQTCIILALVDWGQGDIERAWTLSALAITLSISLSLQGNSNATIDPALGSDPHSYRSKTFQSALIIHTFLSLRTEHPPMIVLGDYQTSPGSETSRSIEGLRPEYSAADGSIMPDGSTLPSMVSLCVIGVDILRHNLRGTGMTLDEGERQRLDLIGRVRDWEMRVPPGLRADEASEMHLIGMVLSMRLRSHPALRGASYDPAMEHLHTAISRLAYHRQSFNDFHRNLPSIELVLHILTDVAFSSDDSHFVSVRPEALNGYAELARLLPIGRSAVASRQQTRPTGSSLDVILSPSLADVLAANRTYRTDSDPTRGGLLYPLPTTSSLLARRRTLPGHAVSGIDSMIPNPKLARSADPYHDAFTYIDHLGALGGTELYARQ